jgi:hypothetical protein
MKKSSSGKVDLEELRTIMEKLGEEADRLKIPMVRRRTIKDFGVVIDAIEKARK